MSGMSVWGRARVFHFGVQIYLPMVPYSPFDDDLTHSDSEKCGIQVPESSERETRLVEQWLPPPSSISHPSNQSSIETSQNKREDRRLQLITQNWLASGRRVDLSDNHRTLANITGRGNAEAFRDFDRLHSPRELSRRTPSLTSDDSHSRDSSPSPELGTGVAEDSLEYNKHSEAAPVSPFRSMEVGSNSKSSQEEPISASIFHSPASPDELKSVSMKCIELSAAYCASESSMPPSEAPPRLSHKSESAFSQHAVQKLGESTTQPPLRQPMCVTQSHTGEGRGLRDSAQKIADGIYLPEPKPASDSGIRSARKPSKPAAKKIGCPECPLLFTRKFDMKRHMKTIHSIKTVESTAALTCTYCEQCLSRKDAFKRHIENIPNSCIRLAKVKPKPAPALLSGSRR